MTLDPKSPSMNLWQALVSRGIDAEEATELMHGYAHELAEQIRDAPFVKDGPARQWDWWDAATIPNSCADLIDPKAQRASTEGDNP